MLLEFLVLTKRRVFSGLTEKSLDKPTRNVLVTTKRATTVVSLARTILLLEVGGKRPHRRAMAESNTTVPSTPANFDLGVVDEVTADSIDVRGRLAVEVVLTDQVVQGVGFDLVQVRIIDVTSGLDLPLQMQCLSVFDPGYSAGTVQFSPTI
jgi:hypothetical protein